MAGRDWRIELPVRHLRHMDTISSSQRRPRAIALTSRARRSIRVGRTSFGATLCGIRICRGFRAMKYATDREYADPEKAARKLLEIANTVEAIQDGRIHIEKINGPFLFKEGGTPAEYKAGLELAIARGWLEADVWAGLQQRLRCAMVKVGETGGHRRSCYAVRDKDLPRLSGRRLLPRN